MKAIQRRRVLIAGARAGAGAVAAMLGVPARAQAYPNRPITFVLGSGPGSTYEGPVRFISAEFVKRTGQPIVIEYKPGAGGLIAANFVHNAKPDGYTFLYGSVLGINPIFVKTSPILASKDLSPVSACAFTPWVVGAATRFQNLQDLVAYSKANPNQLKVGHSTAGVKLTAALIMQKTGLTGEFIPYKTGGQMTLGAASGEIDLFPTATNASVKGLIDGGKVNGIMITSSKRQPSLPNVPSVSELGFADLSVLGVTQGVWGPPGLPAEIANALSAELGKVLRSPEAEKALALSVMGDILASTPQEQLRMFEAEIRLYGEAAKAANFTPQ